jgi:hypothetical protein
MYYFWAGLAFKKKGVDKGELIERRRENTKGMGRA